MNMSAAIGPTPTSLERFKSRKKLWTGSRSDDGGVFALGHEFLSFALFVVAAASMVSAKRSGRCISLHFDPGAYLPPIPVLFHQHPNVLTDTAEHRKIFVWLHDYYVRLAIASRLFPKDTQAWTSSTDGAFGAWENLDNLWQNNCGSTLVGLHLLTDLPFGALPDVAQRVDFVYRLIVEARSGCFPCLRSDGTPYIPGWLEARREPRSKDGGRVAIIRNGTRVEVALSDLSESGMGLSDCPTLPVNEAIAIEFVDGRLMRGRVVWWRDGRAGIRLIRPRKWVEE